MTQNIWINVSYTPVPMDCTLSWWTHVFFFLFFVIFRKKIVNSEKFEIKVITVQFTFDRIAGQNTFLSLSLFSCDCILTSNLWIRNKWTRKIFFVIIIDDSLLMILITSRSKALLRNCGNLFTGYGCVLSITIWLMQMYDSSVVILIFFFKQKGLTSNNFTKSR